ncbi:hypothetical protein GCM10023232_27220 [Sphingosinicella ginsenosidimutans]|uniref:DUF3168 domain-containing protein n=1 Tax=Allosphingosinicella ginsenosidimutans TaxID=1176539 RepID=A0A5C6TTS7_9SPHN|nr:DUF3168 domain-containing protein [Sphingosinicella ginsenosidimutans]TXC63676.1 DUF3168 domain-containing protein [Sphingosinicella ginsenosidimutans]
MLEQTIPARRAVLAHLKGDTGLAALVPPARIYPQSTPPGPTWPFTRFGTPRATPLRASCVAGNEIPFDIHSFAKPRMSGGQVVETAEDHAGRIGAAVVAALDGQALDLPAGRLKVRWVGSQLMQDPEEADAYHHVASFTGRVLA